MMSPTSISSIGVGVHATMSPSIRVGSIESDVTKSTGKGVPENTDRKRAIIRNKAAKNNKLPIIALMYNFMLHPILLSIP
jgi:hypothetical protein